MRKMGLLTAMVASSMASAASTGRVFGFENIRRTLQRQKRDHARHANTSIAQGNRNIRNIRTGAPVPHEHKREIARRLRQAEAKRIPT